MSVIPLMFISVSIHSHCDIHIGLQQDTSLFLPYCTNFCRSNMFTWPTELLRCIDSKGLDENCFLCESPWKHLIFWYVIKWEFAQHTPMHRPWEPCVGCLWWVQSMVYVLTSWSLCYMPWFVTLDRVTTVIHWLPSIVGSLVSPCDAKDPRLVYCLFGTGSLLASHIRKPEGHNQCIYKKIRHETYIQRWCF